MTDDMLMAASETLPDLIRPTDMSLGRVFPRLADIRRGLLPFLCVHLGSCKWVQAVHLQPLFGGSQIFRIHSLPLCYQMITYVTCALLASGTQW